jgi:hypothetical protein
VSEEQLDLERVMGIMGALAARSLVRAAMAAARTASRRAGSGSRNRTVRETSVWTDKTVESI